MLQSALPYVLVTTMILDCMRSSSLRMRKITTIKTLPPLINTNLNRYGERILRNLVKRTSSIFEGSLLAHNAFNESPTSLINVARSP